MIRKCACGEMLTLELRTVMYKHQVQIMHVPVFVCHSCSYYELMGAVKSELKDCMHQLGTDPEPRKLSFTTVSELSKLIYEVFTQYADSSENLEEKVEEALIDRINMLLDLYSYASSVNDKVWMDKLTARLAVLSSVNRQECCIHGNFHGK